jgi:mannose-6-phosphate isomerase-like protein (cupin superfamily)
MEKINVADKLARIHEHWRPKVVAELNGQEVKLVKVEGEFVFHHHADGDELFFVVRGELRVDGRDGSVVLGPGEMIVVPRGVEHRTAAERETEVLIFAPVGLRNTGNVIDEKLSAPEGVKLVE